jgi:type IV pilus assembly protein PilY1
MVFVGTGQLLGLPDLTSTGVQTIYGVYDPPNALASPRTRASLVQQSLSSAVIGGTVVATATNNAVSLPAASGWYIDLTLNLGERVVNTPLLRSGAVIVTSTQPSLSPCTSGGTAFFYYINFSNGSAFPSPQFDANSDGTINQGDLVNNGNGTTSVPIGVQLGTGFFANATLQNCGTACNSPGRPGTSGSIAYNCPASGATSCTPRYTKGAISHRISWWEVHE